MQPGARIGAVIEIYDMILAAGKPADQVMQNYFRQRKFIGSKDRKFVADKLYTLLRHYARLSWWAEQLNFKADGRLMTLLWLALGERQSFKDIQTFFDGTGYAPKKLTQPEQDTFQEISRYDFILDDMPEAVRVECPDWAYDGLKAAFGNDFEQEMAALQTEAPLDLRVNTLKAQRDDVLKALRKADFDIEPTPFSPLGIRVQGRPPFSAQPLYQNGAIEVQDEGSQLLSLLCGVKPGEWVVDFCAGAGGKTLALAAQMNNKGRIWACDVENNRLENSRKRLRRAGVHCVEMQLLKDENDDWVRKHAAKADCVFIDAPCSGVGTWRRNPFARWQDLGPGVTGLVPLQTSILQSASRLVKPGGRLVYATCSLLPEENGHQIDAFLAKNPEFTELPLTDLWPDAPEILGLSGARLQLSPLRHDTDGFFVAALKRN